MPQPHEVVRAVSFLFENYGPTTEKTAEAQYMDRLTRETEDDDALGSKFVKVAQMQGIEPWELARRIALSYEDIEQSTERAYDSVQRAADWPLFMPLDSRFTGTGVIADANTFTDLEIQRAEQFRSHINVDVDVVQIAAALRLVAGDTPTQAQPAVSQRHRKRQLSVRLQKLASSIAYQHADENFALVNAVINQAIGVRSRQDWEECSVKKLERGCEVAARWLETGNQPRG